MSHQAIQQSNDFSRGFYAAYEVVQRRIEEIHQEALRLAHDFNTKAREAQPKTEGLTKAQQKDTFNNRLVNVRGQRKDDPTSGLRLVWKWSYRQKHTGATKWDDLAIRDEVKGHRLIIPDKIRDVEYSLDYLVQGPWTSSRVRDWLVSLMHETETALCGLRFELRNLQNLRSSILKMQKKASALECRVADRQRKYQLTPLFPWNMPPVIEKKKLA